MIYLINLLFSLILAFMLDLNIEGENNKKNLENIKKILLIILFILWVFILGFQDNVGTDYQSYTNIYWNRFETDYTYLFKKEYLFLFLIKGLRDFKQPQILFLIISIIQVTLIFNIIKKVNDKIAIKYAPFIFLYLTSTGLFFSQMNTLRSTTSGLILVNAILLFIDKKYKKSILLWIIALYFHKASLYIYILLMIFYILSKIFNKWFLLFPLIGSYLYLYKFNNVNFLFEILKKIPQYSRYLGNEYFTKIIELGSGLAVIVVICINIYSVYIFKDEKENKFKKAILYIGILSYSLILVSFKIVVLNRITDYFLFFTIFPIYLILVCERKESMVAKIMIYIFYITIFVKNVILHPLAEKIYNNIFFQNI